MQVGRRELSSRSQIVPVSAASHAPCRARCLTFTLFALLLILSVSTRVALNDPMEDLLRFPIKSEPYTASLHTRLTELVASRLHQTRSLATEWRSPLGARPSLRGPMRQHG